MTKLHRPYARMRNQEPSVTTILDVLGKPGLSWAAAKETALFAVMHPDQWRHLHVDDAVDKLRKHHDGLWKGRAAMGTLVHAANEAFCAGEQFDIEREIDGLLASEKPTIWARMDRDDIVEQALGYVLGLERWWCEWQPRVYASESVVRVPGRYIGQADLGMRARVLDADVLVDIKTTAQQDPEKGLYVDTWSLQTAAYNFATEEVFYDVVPDKSLRSGERIVETGTGPWEPADECAIVHLRGDEEYAFYSLPVSRETHDMFLMLCDVYRWLKQCPDKPKEIMWASR